MRLAGAIALITLSCSAPSRSRDTALPPPPPSASPDAPAATSAPIPTKHAPRAMIEAPHAGSIVTLTATPDASAVLSIDELGGARLWPTLDGTREPRVVDLPAARELALGTHPDGFTAVVLDEVGGLAPTASRPARCPCADLPPCGRIRRGRASRPSRQRG